MDTRVRFAPSPTGYLHIGGLRTALYNYLFARRQGGSFVLRVEDTDRTRYVEDAENDIYAALSWAGIEIDEGPVEGGAFGPYRQSERKELYIESAARLVASGSAYYAFDSPEDIAAMRERLRTPENPAPRYDASIRGEMCNSFTLDPDEVARRIHGGDPYVLRLRVDPGGTVSFQDLIRGEVSFATETVDDQVLMKSDGMPTYHLANIIDDHAMEISHVIRGEEWLPSVPKHLLLYRALGWTPPAMAHLPLIMSPSGGKLSKRSAERAGIPVSVREYRRAGYEPGALINFLALLGWNPGDEREFFTLDELISEFSLDRVGSSGVQFDLSKLKWFNEHELRQRPAESIAADVDPLLKEAGLSCPHSFLLEVIEMMRDRISFPADIVESRYLFEDPVAYDEKAVRKRWKDDASALVQQYADTIETLSIFSAETLEDCLRTLAEEKEVGAGRIIHPVRLAVSGVSFGPGLFDLLVLLGQETVVRRLRQAVTRLG